MPDRDWDIVRSLFRPGKKKLPMEKFLSKISISDVTETNFRETTLLHFVAWTGFVDLANMLISKGANVNAKSFSHWTPLHTAARGGHLELIKFLIANGADVNARTKRGNTPLGAARTSGKGKAVILLRSFGGK
jgi:ankyrin repeat protein